MSAYFESDEYEYKPSQEEISCEIAESIERLQEKKS